MTGPDTTLRLAELLAARLCHDLASPLGVLGGLLELADGGDAAALADARAAAASLAGRLRLLRAAWAADPVPLQPAALLELAGAMTMDGHISIDATGLAMVGAFSAMAGRLTLNMLLLGAQALRGQGRLHLAGAAGAEISLRIAGPRAAWPAGTAACLADPDTAWQHLDDARALQLPLTVLLAQQAGLRLGMLLPLTATPDAPPPLRLSLG